MPVDMKAGTEKPPPGTVQPTGQSSVDSSSPSPGPHALEIRLFGPLAARVHGQPLPHLRSRKGLWLLALLALRGGRDVDRDWLAGTLWPDCDEPHARRSLRQTLHDLRTALGTESWRLMSDEPRSLRINLDGAFVDALDFDGAVDRGDEASLELALALYRGPLLEDCGEDWALESRRSREAMRIAALERLASAAANRGDYGAATDHLRAALFADPYREDLLRALMEALSAQGNIAAALLAFRRYRATLAQELAGEPAPETVALFQRLKTESRVASKPEPGVIRDQTGPSQTQISLPVPLTQLIGREENVREVLDLVAKTRLCTLTGTGGVGKTRLAIQVARELASGFPEGVVFVDLAPLENPALLPDTVRDCLKAPPVQGQEEPIDILCRFIAARRILLVLDNCEHLGQACGELADTLLRACEGLKILATSRQTLGVLGETVWRVPSLAVPPTGRRSSVAARDILHVSEYQDFAAVRLFSERAMAALSSFELTHKSAVDIVRICALLDGIPLAIELAAARVKAMPVHAIAARLTRRFRILLGDDHALKVGLLPRHQTLRASIDWSYELLSDLEQTLLGRLAIFVGGWTLDTAEAVCSDDTVPEWQVLDLLTSLVEKSLVAYEPGEDRYRLLETIRQYLLDRREAHPERQEVAARHLGHFLTLVETAEQELKGPGQVEWLNRLDVEHDNIRAALTWSRSKLGDAESGLRMAGALHRYWRVRGFLAEGRVQVELSLRCSTQPTASRAKALNTAGICAHRLSDFQSARSFFLESLSIYRELGDRYWIACALSNIALVASDREDFAEARLLLEEGLAVFRDLELGWNIAVSLQNLGRVAHEQGDYLAARSFYEESLAIRRERGDRTGIAAALTGLGMVAIALGDHDPARRLLDESLAIGREMGDRAGVAFTLHNLGMAAIGLGDYPSARSHLRESLAMRREDRAREAIVESLVGFADLACAEQDSQGSADSQQRGVCLLAASKAIREMLGAPLSSSERRAYDRRLSRAREVLDDGAFAAAWTEGRVMTVEQAVECALGVGASR